MRPQGDARTARAMSDDIAGMTDRYSALGTPADSFQREFPLSTQLATPEGALP